MHVEFLFALLEAARDGWGGLPPVLSKMTLHFPREGTALFICLSVSHLQYLRQHLLDFDSLGEMMRLTFKFQFAKGMEP